MKLIKVTHQTRYIYSGDVVSGYNCLHLTPAEDRQQRCHETSLVVDPQPDYMRHYRDFHGNAASHIQLGRDHRALCITAESIVATRNLDAQEIEKAGGVTVASVREYINADPIHLAPPARRELAEASEFLRPSPLVPIGSAFATLGRRFLPDHAPILGAMAEFCSYIKNEFTYDGGATTVRTNAAKVLRERRGVCQDFSILAIAALRSLGLPARYVSGYIQSTATDSGAQLTGADASHAWVSVFVPGQGWFDFDPTNGKARTDEFVSLGFGRDYTDVAPVSGVIFGGGGKQKLEVAVSVRPL